MNFFNNEKITRRGFVKGAAGVALCCACLPLDRLAALEVKEDIKVNDSNAKIHLAGACGIYCGACPHFHPARDRTANH